MISESEQRRRHGALRTSRSAQCELLSARHAILREANKVARSALRTSSLWRLAAVLLASLASITWAGHPMNPYGKTADGITVEVESWFDSCPPTGMVPLTVRIDNATKSPGAWSLEFRHQSNQVFTASSLNLKLDAGASGEWRALAPVGTSASDYGFLGLQISGTGVSGGAPQLSSKFTGSSAATPFIGVGEDLASSVWEKLGKLVNTASSGSSSSSTDLLRGSRLQMADAPTDWRGYTALHQLWLAEAEWTRLRAEQKRAIVEWVSAGGELAIMTDKPDLARQQELQLPGRVQDRRLCFGAGRVALHQKPATSEGAAALVKQQLDAGRSRDLSTAIEQYRDWSLFKELGTFKMMSGLVLGFIVLFGILVGPVNLLWCSRQARRHLLFITTPVLSIAGTVFLVALMLLQDGTGGRGARFIAAFVEPSANLMTVLQEQCSRTGVLLDRSFTSEEPVWLQMGSIAKKPSAGFSYRPSFTDELTGSYAVEGRDFSGDFFRSRSLQAHYVAAARPTRGGITFTRDPAAPGKATLLSSLALPLKTVFIVQPDATVWKGTDVEAGRKVDLQPCAFSELNGELQRRAKSDAGPVLRKMLEAKTGDRGLFFAFCDDGGKLAIPTLKAIRWDRQPAVVIGPYSE